jgi:hypothetical protein
MMMAMEMASAPVRPGLLIRLKGQLPGAVAAGFGIIDMPD